jgi:ornithine decarboxylase
LDAGVSPQDIIYANPCKQSSHIRYAANNDVHVMTFDNADELYKVKSINPNAKMVLRILTDDSKSLCRFGVKFGASLSLIPHLLNTARGLDLDVIGISFHVGSGCFDASSFTDAVELARQAFDIGSALGFDFELLDIGGGFPGNRPDGLQFTDIAAVLAPTIDRLFPKNVRVISEPGRYFVSSAYTLAVNVVARRVTPSANSPGSDSDEESSFMCKLLIYSDYINDGMYGSFNCITFDHATVKPEPLMRSGQFCYRNGFRGPQFLCSIWGPTCDSIDLIGKDITMPEMKIGDWIVFHNMGAYTIAAASCFNGFQKSAIIYTNTNQ